MDTNSFDIASTDAAAGALLAIRAAAAGASVQKLERHPFVINPLTGQPVSLAEFLDKPLGIVETRSFLELESFVAYVTKFKGEGAVIVAGSGHSLTAVLDYHRGPAEPERGQHKATFTLTQTESLKAWREHNGKQRNQLDFVEFLEERAGDIITPDPATILEIAQELHVVNGAQVKSCVRSGAEMKVEFIKTETVKTSGDVSLPVKMEVSIQPFEDQPARISTVARLRVRNRDGVVTLGYSLDDLPAKIGEAFASIAHTAGKSAAVDVFI